jgi:hypothetical protein
MNTYEPRAFVDVVSVIPVCVFVNFKAAPTTTAPLESVTVPVTSPLADWAEASWTETASNTHAAKNALVRGWYLAVMPSVFFTSTPSSYLKSQLQC